jgi:hypothetical protein
MSSTHSLGFLDPANLAKLQFMNFFLSLVPTYRAGAGLKLTPAPRLFFIAG